MLTWLLAGLIVVMKLFPTTPAARALHRAFVERPLERLASMGRAHLIFTIVALVALFASAELIMLLGSTQLIAEIRVRRPFYMIRRSKVPLPRGTDIWSLIADRGRDWPKL